MARDDITLHPELGLNPRLTTCTRCGADSSSIALLGIRNSMYTCETCGCHTVETKPTAARCHVPGCRGRLHYERDLHAGEKLPMGLCDKCEGEDKAFADEVAAGGVYWRCVKEPNHHGVLRAGSSLASAVRKSSGIATGPVGVEFTGDDCPACHPELVAPSDISPDTEGDGRSLV